MDFSIKLIDGKLKIFDAKTSLPVFQDLLTYSYTLTDDDITKGERGYFTSPYDSRMGSFNQIKALDEKDGFALFSDDGKTRLNIAKTAKVLELLLETTATDFSEFGLNLPFNFMGKFNGGGYKNQYLFNSPYRSNDSKIKFCYLSNLNGRNLVVLFDCEADGWKVDYSKYLSGHYFESLKCLANFDKVYKSESKNKKLSLKLFIAKDFNDAIKKVSKILNKPMLFYDKNFALNGSGAIKVLGKCDYVEMESDGVNKRLYPKRNVIYFDGAKYKTTFTPYFNGARGGDCSVYGYNELYKLWKKANDKVCNYGGEFIPDDNACEGQCWVESLLRYSIRFNDRNLYSKRLNEHFENVLMQIDPDKASPRATILDKPHKDYPAYHIFESTRIQEQFFAVSIFLNAYKCFGEDKYLTYCLKTLDTLIDCYQKSDGRIERNNPNGKKEDYSTVTCLILSIIDVSTFIKNKDDDLYVKYSSSAKKLAEYVYSRGFSFPTEGGETELAEEEFEDGSISCSALTLLYYCYKIERVEKYIKMAKRILDFHETWVMNTPDCNVYRSSLRWWETIWEGDADGPALCCGHGWTIWRAEADYWYYKLTGKREYLDKSLSGFTNNFAKFNTETGEGKSIYSMDYITGGGPGDKSKVNYKISLGFPHDIDVRLAYYVFMRADATIFNEKYF